MTSIISNLNKIFESRIRLGIMSILSVNEYADFNMMKQLLEVTDGNLASHLNTLEKAEYIQSSKQFIGRKPNTRYNITQIGKQSFQTHINALENLLK